MFFVFTVFFQMFLPCGSGEYAGIIQSVLAMLSKCYLWKHERLPVIVKWSCRCQKDDLPSQYRQVCFVLAYTVLIIILIVIYHLIPTVRGYNPRLSAVTWQWTVGRKSEAGPSLGSNPGWVSGHFGAYFWFKRHSSPVIVPITMWVLHSILSIECRTKLDRVAVLWAASSFPRDSANLSLGLAQ